MRSLKKTWNEKIESERVVLDVVTLMVYQATVDLIYRYVYSDIYSKCKIIGKPEGFIKRVTQQMIENIIIIR